LAALPGGSEIFIQGIMVAKKKAQETFLRSTLQKKVAAGQSSISMLNDVREIEKVFRASRTKLAGWLQIQ